MATRKKFICFGCIPRIKTLRPPRREVGDRSAVAKRRTEREKDISGDDANAFLILSRCEIRFCVENGEKRSAKAAATREGGYRLREDLSLVVLFSVFSLRRTSFFIIIYKKNTLKQFR